MEVKIVYITNHPSQQRANKKYRENNRELLSERARNKYYEDIEYKERKLKQMREYARKRRELIKLKQEEEIKKGSESIGNL